MSVCCGSATSGRVGEGRGCGGTLRLADGHGARALAQEVRPECLHERSAMGREVDARDLCEPQLDEMIAHLGASLRICRLAVTRLACTPTQKRHEPHESQLVHHLPTNAGTPQSRQRDSARVRLVMSLSRPKVQGCVEFANDPAQGRSRYRNDPAVLVSLAPASIRAEVGTRTPASSASACLSRVPGDRPNGRT